MNDFSPFFFDLDSYEKVSSPNSTTSSNLSDYVTSNPICHLSFRGLSLLIGGDELISYSPWKTYSEGFHVDVAPSHILRNIPSMKGRMLPFTTMIPLGYDYNEYTLDDLPHRDINIDHPHNKINVVFGNVLLMTGDTIHQDTTNMRACLGLHPTIIGHISSTKVDLYLADVNYCNLQIDPIELTPLNTLNLDLHQIKDFILSQKHQTIDFLKCAIPHMDQLRIQSDNFALVGRVQRVLRLPPSFPRISFPLRIKSVP